MSKSHHNDKFAAEYIMPLEAADSRVLVPEGERVEFEVAGRLASMWVSSDQVKVRIADLESREDAEAMLLALRAGLALASLELALTPVPYRAPAGYYGVPSPVPLPEGLDDCGYGAIVARNAFVTAKRLELRWRFSVEWGSVAECLRRGSAFAHNLTHPRLRLALDLRAAAEHDRSAAAQLLLYVASLESLCEQRPKHPVAQEQIEIWSGQLGKWISALPDGDELKESLIALRREIESRAQESVRQSLRRTVRDLLTRDGQVDDVPAVFRELDQLYDIRSTLAHDGKLQDEGVAEWARNVNRRILLAALRVGLPR